MQHNCHRFLLFVVLALFFSSGNATSRRSQKPGSPSTPISLSSLLDEMMDRRAVTEFPAPFYQTAQTTSYDRRSVAPDVPGWYGNEDGRGFIRTEQNNGRTERVLFDEEGPGAVTRLWITTSDKQGTLRFYFDGEQEASVVIPAFDLNMFPIPMGKGLMFNHSRYSTATHDRGGNTSYLPMPYERSLKITLEDGDTELRIVRYYQVGFRRYEANTAVRSFTLEEMEQCRTKMEKVNVQLLNPRPYGKGKVKKAKMTGTNSLTINRRNAAIYGINLRLSDEARQHYADVMNKTKIQILFDGTQCVDVPLCDFFAGGRDGAELKGWYTDCDGAGTMHSRWIMPFRQKAEVRFKCQGEVPFAGDVEIITDRNARTPNTLYFHASGHEEQTVSVSNKFNTLEVYEWNFATIRGRGVYVGDVLAANNRLRARTDDTDDNYWKEWYGEGDEKIWIDDDRFPSYHGTGTEDYYNCSWSPPVPTMLTPYGGVPRVDDVKGNRGWMTWQRVRLLDTMTFRKGMKFNFEIEGWSMGQIDVSNSYFWYGDLKK